MKKNLWKMMWIWIFVFPLMGTVFPVQTASAAENAGGGKIKVACVGDSVTFGYLSSNPDTKSYPARLQELLGDGYTVMNFGRNSATLLTGTDMAYEDQQEYKNSLLSDPDIVIIMLGSNDSKAKYWNTGGRERFAADARKLVSTYQNLPSNPKVVFATSPFCLCADKNDIRGNIIENEIVPMQRQLIQENGWQGIDMFALTQDKDNLYQSDGGHFLDVGYFYEAECMYEAVTGESYLPKALPVVNIESLTQQPGNEAKYAIDDDYSTIWHSAWEPVSPREKHMLTLELKERSFVEGIRYLPRQDASSNGIITEYEIQISNDGGRHYTDAASGTWETDTFWKQARFEYPMAATHIKLIAKNGSGGYSSAAEIRVDGRTYTPDSLLEARENLQADYDACTLCYTDKSQYEMSSWDAFTEKMQAVQNEMNQNDLTLAKAESLLKELRNAVLSLQKKEMEVLDIKKVMKRKFYMEKDGTILPYRIYLPEGYSPKKKYPLMLFLHGAGARGITNSKQLEDSNEYFFERMLGTERTAYPAIIVVPQCPDGEQWVDTPWENGCYHLESVAKSNEMEAVEGLLASLVETYSVNRNRLYIVGVSMGAFGVWDLIMRNPDLIAAAVPIAGAGDPAQADKIKNIPIWCFHGEDDTTVPCKTSTFLMAEALKTAGSDKIRYTEYPAGTYADGHMISPGVYAEKELLSWIFAQKKEMNTADLSAVVSSVDKMDPEEYTEESFQEFLSALVRAKEVLSDDSVQQNEIDEALYTLKEAKGNLKKAKKEPLQHLKTPQILSVSRKAANVTLFWKAVSYASGYEISYRTTGAYKAVPITGGTASSYRINRINTKAVYMFRIRAYRDTNDGRMYSDYSAWDKKSVSIPTPKIDLVKKSKKLICVKWKKISGASGYKILRKTEKKGKFKVLTTIKTGRKICFTDKKAKPGKKYFYKVCAFVKEGKNTVMGPYSPVKNLKIQ